MSFVGLILHFQRTFGSHLQISGSSALRYGGTVLAMLVMAVLVELSMVQRLGLLQGSELYILKDQIGGHGGLLGGSSY